MEAAGRWEKTKGGGRTELVHSEVSQILPAQLWLNTILNMIINRRGIICRWDLTFLVEGVKVYRILLLDEVEFTPLFLIPWLLYCIYPRLTYTSYRIILPSTFLSVTQICKNFVVDCLCLLMNCTLDKQWRYF